MASQCYRIVSVIQFTPRLLRESKIWLDDGGGCTGGFLHNLEPFYVFGKCTMLKKKRNEVIFTRFRGENYLSGLFNEVPGRLEAVSPVLERKAENNDVAPIFHRKAGLRRNTHYQRSVQGFSLRSRTQRKLVGGTFRSYQKTSRSDVRSFIRLKLFLLKLIDHDLTVWKLRDQFQVPPHRRKQFTKRANSHIGLVFHFR